MLCKDVIKMPVKSCFESTPVAECAKLMLEYDIGFLPIIDARGVLVGVVTDRDLALRVLAQDRSAHTGVGRVMSRAAVTCGPEDTLDFAIDRLKAAKKSRIVVVDADRRLLGVVSLSDIGRIASPARAGAALRSITRRETAEQAAPR